MKTVRIHKKEGAQELTKSSINVMSSLLNRMQLGASIGMQSYKGDRDISQALGYKENLTFDDFLARYFRHDMAKAIIDRPVKASWKGEIEILENNKSKRTKFEKAWRNLYVTLKLKSVFIRADKLTGLGRYSVILLGLNDVNTEAGFQRKVKIGAKLVYVKPFSEKSAVVESWEENQRSARFGKPLFYKIKMASQSVNSSMRGQTDTARTSTLLVHYSRVVHLTEDVLEDEINGIPRLQVVFNRLMDLDKLIGGDAEMFWRGARPGYTGSVKPEYEMTPEMRTDLEDQIKEFEHNLKRVMVNEGIDYKSLEQQIADPASHVDVQVQMIAAVTGIPKRILVGSERGELSSAQDKQEWISYVTSRREEQNEPGILRPFIDHLLYYKIIPQHKSEEYIVVWDKLFSLSDKEKVELGKNRAIALKEYSTNPAAQYMFPLVVFMKYFLGMDENQIASINEYNTENREKELTLEELAELGAKARQFERTTAQDSRTEDGSNKKKEEID